MSARLKLMVDESTTDARGVRHVHRSQVRDIITVECWVQYPTLTNASFQTRLSLIETLCEKSSNGFASIGPLFTLK